MAGRKRVVVAGLGDVGLLTAIRLAKHADVVGISVKDALVSGQELGVRLSRPGDWARDYWIPFDRFRGLDRVRTVQAELTGVDLADRTVFARGSDGAAITEEFDALVISTGVTNGFWRQPIMQSGAEIAADLHATHQRLAAAESIIVIGGGAAAVSSAVNLATTWPNKRIDLYFPGPDALAGYHPRIWKRIRGRLGELSVGYTRGTARSSRTGPGTHASRANLFDGAPDNHRPPRRPCCGRWAGCGRTPTGYHPTFSTRGASFV